MAKPNTRAATQAALNGTPKTPQELAAEAQAKQDAAAQKAAAQLREANADELSVAEDDAEYAKALNEVDGLTLIHKNKVAKNGTVERVGTKVYPNDMVIAKRL